MWANTAQQENREENVFEKYQEPPEEVQMIQEYGIVYELESQAKPSQEAIPDMQTQVAPQAEGEQKTQEKQNESINQESVNVFGWIVAYLLFVIFVCILGFKGILVIYRDWADVALSGGILVGLPVFCVVCALIGVGIWRENDIGFSVGVIGSLIVSILVLARVFFRTLKDNHYNPIKFLLVILVKPFLALILVFLISNLFNNYKTISRKYKNGTTREIKVRKNAGDRAADMVKLTAMATLIYHLMRDKPESIERFKEFLKGKFQTSKN
ncbi:hypothetical protein [Helicobacter ganmani]|uniref:hypothetical protein n=1 Tax=Helicobacter ganmani TaxID=60246 RepID=UPI003A8649F2